MYFLDHVDGDILDEDQGSLKVTRIDNNIWRISYTSYQEPNLSVSMMDRRENCVTKRKSTVYTYDPVDSTDVPENFTLKPFNIYFVRK